ncbi:BN159_2729 family protein [Streptomyces sp. NPDC029526]|uniref:BN159_2729 family protein n=1 Tax=Streptomyces sp. NPDC029526 TaxID=3155728 RepID=UPI0033CDC4FE
MNERPLHAVDGHLPVAYDPLPTGEAHAYAADAHLPPADGHGYAADAHLPVVDGHGYAADASLPAADGHAQAADGALRLVDGHPWAVVDGRTHPEGGRTYPEGGRTYPEGGHIHPEDGHPHAADGFPEHARADAPVDVRTVSVVRVTVTACRHDHVLDVHLPDAPAALPAGLLEFPVRTLPSPAGHLHVLPGGGGTEHLAPAPARAPTATPEQDAAARARAVARAVEREVGTHPDVHGVRADGDTVRVLLGLAPPYPRWDAWCAYFGVTVSGEAFGPRTLAGEGRRDGVRVTVVARGPDRPHGDGAGGTAERTYRHGGTTYDLTLPHRDAHGETWYFQGLRTPDGMPLMSVDGRPERCSLANVAEYAGPLTPVRGVPHDEEDR